MFLFAPAWAATFTVTNCATSVIQAGSLAWAVEEAYKTADEDSIIEFNIPATESGYITAEGIWQIQPDDSNALNLRRNAVQIRGSTQALYQGDTNPYGPEILVDGANLSAAYPLFKINGFNSCTIEGMIINNSKTNGVEIASSSNNHIYGCYIGTDASAEAPVANLNDGIYIYRSDSNIIGGLSVQRNIISGNSQNAIEINNSKYTKILNTLIGTNNLNKNIGNGNQGILINAGSQNQYIAGQNVLAFNGGDGVRIDGSTTNYNTLAQNSYFLNAGQGISLTSGGNSSIAYPVVATAEYYSTFDIPYLLYVQGAGPANSTIEILKVGTLEAGTRGEGEKTIGFALADGNGNWLSYFATDEVQPGDRLTALATDPSGSTSEFALNLAVTGGTVIYRPDGMIANLSDGSDYVGADIYNTTGFGQSKAKTILNSQAAIYYIKVKNSGNISPDNILITGTGNAADWQIKYYDAKIGGNDITANVTGPGQLTTSIPSAESYEFRVEAISTGTTASSKDVLINLASASNTSRRDVIKAATSATVPPVTNNFYFEITAPTTCEVGKAFNLTVTARNPAGQITTEVVGKSTVSADQGTISPTSIEASDFSDDGIWSGPVTLSLVGDRIISITNPSISTTATARIEVQIPGYVVTGGLVRFGPNPYNPNSGVDAVFWYWLNEDKATDIYIFDMYGNNIWKQTYLSGGIGAKAGVNAVTWNGRNAFGEVLENGTYFFRVAQANKIVFKGKIIILK
jgi:hypothetical protein